ncbi:MAG TPA: glycosyl hydrolase [Verrucomicrobiae bacterium]
MLLILCGGLSATAASATSSASTAWPPITSETRPWAYWWWMGSAVDTNNLAKELARYRDAGMGGVHIIPIYGAKGWESNYITYLGPKWMEMLDFTVTEAKRLGLGVDMTTGTGWCFGGPRVTDNEANASMVSRTFEVADGGRLTNKFDAQATQALMAFGPEGQREDLGGKIAMDGSVNWTASGGPWRVFAVSQKPSGQKVKRASPGGQGHMLNLLYPPAMTNYLRWFDEAFANYKGAKPRAQYHDSYEYRSDWSPDFFAQFEHRRGYRLQDHLDAFFTGEPADRAARVKCDYRETISDIMAEVTLPMWTDWAHRNGFVTRNEAHGSPGNWLDLYAAADIPETEMFYKDRNKLISKFASSAAHVTGKKLVGCETGTWLAEHFTETLADMKYLLDDLFLSGVNHVFYHGTCYSPDEAPWPGWLFYASYEMNPRNSIWRDVPALNAYVARCQAVLQSGKADNDILLYWPLHDFWHDAKGTARNMTVHARDWFEEQPVGHTASNLWARGYAFDYISDRQLAAARVRDGKIRTPGGDYQVIVVPPCERLPLLTFSNLVALANAGASVVFEHALPKDVSGWAGLENQRASLAKLTAAAGQIRRILVGDLEGSLASVGVVRESLFDRPGLMCLRRVVDGSVAYFIANRAENPVDGWIPLAKQARSIVVFDPLTGHSGAAATRQNAANQTEVFLQLAAGESIILRCSAEKSTEGPPWAWWEGQGDGTILTGLWQVQFLAGGPELPAPFATANLASWTEVGDTNAQRFAGTALYTLKFDRPAQAGSHWQLELGTVCQSARVRLNGKDLGTRIIPPFRVVVSELKPKDNLLEVEVTNVSANRIRDLDRRGVNWKNFHDINFVNLNYKPFDASNWPLADSGLLGPVTLTPVVPLRRW